MKRIIVNIMNAIRMKLGLRPIDEKIRSMENGGFVWIEEGETS
jgi:hypothetical protein